jgi:uncharacterized cupredoxin-like copper-binding protein
LLELRTNRPAGLDLGQNELKHLRRGELAAARAFNSPCDLSHINYGGSPFVFWTREGEIRKECAMSTSTKYAAWLAAGFAFALFATAASAATVVKVELWDKGGDVGMVTGLTYATPGADMSKATMGIKLSQPSAPAGDVTFEVTNTSKDTIHEMIVMLPSDASKPLPFIDAENRVDEDAAGDKGEVSELEPGGSGSLTVNLKAGTYLLICNVPGHFSAGMWATFTVAE